jgi:hypothetical protein
MTVTTRFHLSPPPPPIHGAAPTLATTQDASGGTFVLEPPPPDVVNGTAPVAPEPAAPVTVLASPVSEVRAATHLHDVDYTQTPDPRPLVFSAPAVLTTPTVPLVNEEAFRIALAVAPAWSGDEAWAAVSLDPEADLPGARHLGLGFGLLLFTQESGLLGEALQLFHERDAEAFVDAFGADASKLLASATATTPEQRLASVGEALLWQGAWPGRFRAAGGVPQCQFAQNEVAVERVVRPAAATAIQLGLTTDRGVAAAVDLVVAAGAGGGLRALVASVAPFTSRSQLDDALRTLSIPDVPALQAAGGVPRTGVWDAPTVATLVSSLRAGGHDPSSPQELLARVVAKSSGAARRRFERLASTTDLDDRLLTTPVG